MHFESIASVDDLLVSAMVLLLVLVLRGTRQLVLNTAVLVWFNGMVLFRGAQCLIYIVVMDQ